MPAEPTRAIGQLATTTGSRASRSSGVLAPAQSMGVSMGPGQLSDVADRPAVELAREARHLRTYPGRGQLDIVGFLAAAHRGADMLPPLSDEPASDALELLPLQVVAEETMFSTLDVLARAGCNLARVS